MLKVAMPRPSTDAVTRADGRSALEMAPFTELAEQLHEPPPKQPWKAQQNVFDDELDSAPVRRLTKADVDVLKSREPVLSPWKVITAQLGVGIGAALVALLVYETPVAAWSAFYGAAVVFVPGALMARGATSRLSSISPVVSTVAMLGWGVVKMVVSVVMLALASRIVPGLVWPVMLVTMAVCLQTYWLALLWRGRAGVAPMPARERIVF